MGLGIWLIFIWNLNSQGATDSQRADHTPIVKFIKHERIGSFIDLAYCLVKGGISMLKMERISDIYDMKVFTDNGEYFGDIEETIITKTKIHGWRVKATKNSYLSKVLGSARGVIVPHQLVKSIGDVMIISKAAVPSGGSED